MKNITCLGCYTEERSENLGDYMYYEIFKKYFDKHRVEFCHLHPFATQPRDELIKETDLFIIGGGGIMYEKAEQVEILRSVRKKIGDVPYCMVSVGLQLDAWSVTTPLDISKSPVMSGYIDIIKGAKFIYARSEYDRAIMSKFNSNVTVYPDLCFTLRELGMAAPLPRKPRDVVITAGSILHMYPYKALIDQLKGYGHKHVHAPFWEKDELPDSTWGDVRICNKPESICDYSDLYGSAAYVFSTRYHGYLFARLHKVPHTIPVLPTYKLANHEHESPEYALKQLEQLKNYIDNQL